MQKMLNEDVKKVRSATTSMGGGVGGNARSKTAEKASFENMIAGSSVDSSMCSAIDNAIDINANDTYSQSMLVSSMVKEPEDLIDRDLINLLRYIKTLKFPSEDEVKAKEIELGEVTRYKTLIFDLDETLIHSRPLPEDQQILAGSFEIKVGESGLRF